MAATRQKGAGGLTSAVPRATLNDEELVSPSSAFPFSFLWTRLVVRCYGSNYATISGNLFDDI